MFYNFSYKILCKLFWSISIGAPAGVSISRFEPAEFICGLQHLRLKTVIR